MFLGYSKLLVMAWLHEPAVLPVANIMYVNAALKYSPVLLQAYGVHQTAQTYIKPFPFRPDTPAKGQGLLVRISKYKNETNHVHFLISR